MYVLAPNGVVEKASYSIGQLQKDNPNTSFPKNPGNALLAEWNVFPIRSTPGPSYDPITQNIKEGIPAIENGEWVQVWELTNASPEEIEERTAQRLEGIKAQRAAAYKEESDPLFFKAQRGEATMEEWIAKVDEIRNRYPYPEAE